MMVRTPGLLINYSEQILKDSAWENENHFKCWISIIQFRCMSFHVFKFMLESEGLGIQLNQTSL